MPTTTAEESLLAAVAAAPRDAAPRLVYADWLQERGMESKADYLRAIVRLMQPPEDRADVARCTSLAPLLDADWRQRVGARFEVVVEGAAVLLLFAHLFRAMVNIARHEAFEMWQSGKPVRLQSGLTREDAERFVQTFGVDLPLQPGSEGLPVRFVVRLMEDDPVIGIISPPVGPRE